MLEHHYTSKSRVDMMLTVWLDFRHQKANRGRSALPKYKFQLDLRAFGKGRKFFQTRSEANAECFRQKTLLERHSREAIDLSQREMSDFITAREKLAKYGKVIGDGVDMLVDHEERIRRCKTTVAQLAAEVVAAKRRDGLSEAYVDDLQLRLSHFSGLRRPFYCRSYSRGPG